MNKQEVMALFVDDVEARKKAIHTFISDKSNSFEDRKEVFLNTPKHLYTNDSWIMHLDEFDAKYGEISWYDDFSAERYSDVDLVEIIKDAEVGEFDFFKTQEMLDDFTREVVETGYHAFNLDW